MGSVLSSQAVVPAEEEYAFYLLLMLLPSPNVNITDCHAMLRDVGAGVGGRPRGGGGRGQRQGGLGGGSRPAIKCCMHACVPHEWLEILGV